MFISLRHLLLRRFSAGTLIHFIPKVTKPNNLISSDNARNVRERSLFSMAMAFLFKKSSVEDLIYGSKESSILCVTSSPRELKKIGQWHKMERCGTL
jgi:hypothetical protein